MTEEQKKEEVMHVSNGVGNEEKVDEQPDLAKQIEEKDAELADVKDQLLKLQNKDHNFKKLRDMTDEERDKLTDRETELMQRQDKLEEDQSQWSDKLITGHKDDALNVLVGNDEELRKKAEFHYKRIIDEATTKQEVADKMREAVLLAKGGENMGVDSISRAAGYHSGRGITDTGDKTKLSSEGKGLASRLGINDDDLKKHNIE